MRRNPVHITLGAALWLLLGIPLTHAITYEDWSAVVFTPAELADPGFSGANADADGDGRSNFLEFTLASAPRVAGTVGDVPLWLGGDGHLRMAYPRLKSRAGLLYAPMVTSDLRGGWYAGPEFLEDLDVADRDTLAETVTVRDLFGLSAASRRFIRLFVAVDSDNDGLPDDWEMELFGNLDQVGSGDFDLDALTNLYEWQHGGGPNAADYYNGHLPTLAIIGGNAQQAGPKVFLPQPLTVEVRSASAGLLANAPVHFEITTGWGELAPAGDQPTSTSLDLRTDALGPGVRLVQNSRIRRRQHDPGFGDQRRPSRRRGFHGDDTDPAAAAQWRRLGV